MQTQPDLELPYVTNFSADDRYGDKLDKATDNFWDDAAEVKTINRIVYDWVSDTDAELANIILKVATFKNEQAKHMRDSSLPYATRVAECKADERGFIVSLQHHIESLMKSRIETEAEYLFNQSDERDEPTFMED